MKTAFLAGRIWCFTFLVFGSGWFLFALLSSFFMPWWSALPATIAAAIASLPTLLLLVLALPRIEYRLISFERKRRQLGFVCVLACTTYGMIGAVVTGSWIHPFRDPQLLIESVAGYSALLSACALIALALSNRQMSRYFTSTIYLSNNKNTNMETTLLQTTPENGPSNRPNKVLYKGITTGILILAMLIPTAFITELVRERQERQSAVVKEVSARWAGDQTLTGPYLYVPFTWVSTNADNKPVPETRHLLAIPDDLNVNGRVEHELRQRSIYKVLLYHAALTNDGNFQFQLPKDIRPDQVQWQDVRVCFGLSDFKGIEERLVIQFDHQSYELSPGLPVNDVNEKGLSASIPLTAADLGKSIPFHLNVNVRGSEMLHFVPLSGNSRFTLASAWPNPSFDGNNLPTERAVSDNGFSAKWAFNKANLPFGTVLRDFKFDQSALAFGITMVQPADEYAKTNRSVKYAILIIGLTFSLFFIVELLQKKPLHPIQYVLVGLALVIFYSLLLAISEFLYFDMAYLIASLATIVLITLYARSHFKTWKSAGIFGGVLSLLYGFIFVLIRLEDTALLIGSIGLFIILALCMYASKKINWYGTESIATA